MCCFENIVVPNNYVELLFKLFLLSQIAVHKDIYLGIPICNISYCGFTCQRYYSWWRLIIIIKICEIHQIQIFYYLCSSIEHGMFEVGWEFLWSG